MVRALLLYRARPAPLSSRPSTRVAADLTGGAADSAATLIVTLMPPLDAEPGRAVVARSVGAGGGTFDQRDVRSAGEVGRSGGAFAPPGTHAQAMAAAVR
ncbi:hypothetical protein HEK131_24630 [Streptomyces seoulensis]|nr:hypothetical protein HEK131_24630 [Streptomyces seoulensis]